MKAGELNRRVEVWRAVPDPDDLNSGTFAYPGPAALVRWAKIESAAVAARVVNQQLRALASHVVTFRGRADIRPNDRLRLPSGAMLNILAIANPDGLGVELAVVCLEVVAGG